ncbi:hypothetical protein AURDEDRAFT_189021 [Auricularia subglabra TFB-10046 SS5]|uniref:VWFA domain-containing protein n=1 Tax=Auricularia subglabra (strain TFB-10046 / SS5) TaxID=717982 RepID=J0WPJ1_AURST|nr:hypothetical protein AURDEDRAFT_189021 [Auricularia subglabra TFB-10046 SS5]
MSRVTHPRPETEGLTDDWWALCLSCWRYNPADRPTIQGVLVSLGLRTLEPPLVHGPHYCEAALRSDPAPQDLIPLRTAQTTDQHGFITAMGKIVSPIQNEVRTLYKTANGIVRRLYGLNREFSENMDDEVDEGETMDNNQFVQDIDGFVSSNPVLERFFKGHPNYIRELAKKAKSLQNDTTTLLGYPHLLQKTVQVTLHQQVVYCDDSSSMKRDNRWDAQTALVKRIAQITTRILPEGGGVALRFINQDVDASPNLSSKQIGDIMARTRWAPNGNTEIGTHLRAKILQPMVYSKLESKTLARPLLVSIMTDGMPSKEPDNTLVNAIKECGDTLQGAGYPRECVKFVIGQVGTANQATRFLNALRDNQDIADVVFVTPGRLDDQFAKLKANDSESELDRWLIETLFSSIRDRPA